MWCGYNTFFLKKNIGYISTWNLFLINSGSDFQRSRGSEHENFEDEKYERFKA